MKGHARLSRRNLKMPVVIVAGSGRLSFERTKRNVWRAKSKLWHASMGSWRTVLPAGGARAPDAGERGARWQNRSARPSSLALQEPPLASRVRRELVSRAPCPGAPRAPCCSAALSFISRRDQAERMLADPAWTLPDAKSAMTSRVRTRSARL